MRPEWVSRCTFSATAESSVNTYSASGRSPLCTRAIAEEMGNARRALTGQRIRERIRKGRRHGRGPVRAGAYQVPRNETNGCPPD